MRLTPCMIAFVLMAASGAATAPVAAGNTAPLQSRPHTMRCQSSVNVWVQVDSDSLPALDYANTEPKKRVQLHLIGSTPARGDSVVCNYASRSRDITTSYSERCVDPRKLRGFRNVYSCK